MSAVRIQSHLAFLTPNLSADPLPKLFFEKKCMVCLIKITSNFSLLFLKYLNENGRYGIPFNIIYTKTNPEGIPLSELLSNKEIIKILKK